MSRILLLTIALAFGSLSFAQETPTHLKREMVPYFKGYTWMEQVKALPTVVQPYTGTIRDYLKAVGYNMYDYYTKAEAVSATETIIKIKLWHKDGFVNQKKVVDKNNLKPGDPKIVKILSGNLSGKDGIMTIDRQTGFATKFELWD